MSSLINKGGEQIVWGNDIDSVIRQVLIQSNNGKVSGFYALISAEPEYDIYTKEDERVATRERIRKTAETARFVHLVRE